MRHRFIAGTLPWDINALVIGTSRTKYVNEESVGATVHSYRGANLADLTNVVSQYPPLNIHTVTLIAGFNDHRVPSENFIFCYRALLDLIKYKFQPRILIAPKIIATSNNSSINQKIHSLNWALYNFFNSYIKEPLIISPFFNLNKSHFCQDGIHFSYSGNRAFSSLLNNFMNNFNACF